MQVLVSDTSVLIDAERRSLLEICFSLPYRLCIMYRVMSIASPQMSEKHSIAEARRNLPTLIRKAESGKVVELTRHGEPVAVLLGHRLFERLSAGRRGFAEVYQDFTKAVDLSELALDPEELFEGARDTTPGRDVRL